VNPQNPLERRNTQVGFIPLIPPTIGGRLGWSKRYAQEVYYYLLSLPKIHHNNPQIVEQL